MAQNPLITLMQHAYTKAEHEKLRKEAKKIEFKIPEKPTLENPDFIVNEDYIHSLAGTIQMGAVGFETFGMGSGYKNARSLWDAKDYEVVYNYEGDERLNTAAVVWNNMDFNNPKSILANSLYQVFLEYVGRSFDEKEFDKITPLIEKILESYYKSEDIDPEVSHINIDSVKELFGKLTETSSYWADCKLMVEFITESDDIATIYTFGSSYNDLTQDIHYSFDYNTDFCGLYFHTGCDARCGFSSPVFGFLVEGRIEESAMCLYHRLDYLGDDYKNVELVELIRKNYDPTEKEGRIPYEDEGSSLTYWLRENGWIEIILKEKDKVGKYYIDREIKLTQKALDFIAKYNPRQKKLDEFLE